MICNYSDMYMQILTGFTGCNYLLFLSIANLRIAFLCDLLYKL